MLHTWLEKPNLHNRMQAKRSLRETDNSTAARKGRTCIFTSVLPLRAGRYERHFPQATLRSLAVMNIQPIQGCFA
ncbi:MAG: hypothetical protein LBV41_10980 [Cytophagaceae bacterium]|jgi:hypothetical protein|nr:hypothetical protein [Cytophagaceae bacterium]